ncbi:MAG: aminotransferase class V-fold PLP-dependent enzyme [bacterium]
MVELYCDYNATTPLKKEVFAAMKPYLETTFGNPSSIHRVGRKARDGVEAARRLLARTFSVAGHQVIFTASGSEANCLALRGVLRPPYSKRKIIASGAEHPSILKLLKWLEKQGAKVKYAPLIKTGELRSFRKGNN